MKRTCTLMLSGVVCATVTACAFLPRERLSAADPTLPRKSSVPLYRDIAQLFTSLSPRFAVCQGTDCPAPTPKTLAYTDEPVASSTLTPVPSTSDPVSPAASAAVARPVVVEEPSTPKAVTQTVVARVTLSFPTASSYLTPAMQKRLDDSLPASSLATKVVIRGRTDDIGPTQVNDKLAYLRALAVRNHLVSRKAATDEQLEIDSKGSCCYVIANTDEKCRAMNRRVEVEFVSQS